MPGSPPCRSASRACRRAPSPGRAGKRRQASRYCAATAAWAPSRAGAWRMQGAGTGTAPRWDHRAAPLGAAPPAASLIGWGKGRGRSPDAQALAGCRKGQVSGGRVGVRGRPACGSSSDKSGARAGRAYPAPLLCAQPSGSFNPAPSAKLRTVDMPILLSGKLRPRGIVSFSRRPPRERWVGFRAWRPYPKVH